MKYQVTWGVDSSVVEATDENSAWAQFCQSHHVARVNPKLYERKVLEVTEEPQRVVLVESEPVVEPVVVELLEDEE